MVEMGNIWDRTTEFLGDNAKALWPIAAVGVFVPQSFSLVMGRAASDGVAPIAVGLIALVCALVSLWGQLAVTALALDPDGGRPRAIGMATAGYGRTVLALLVVFVVLVVLALPIGLALGASGIDFAAVQRGDQSSLAGLSGGTGAFIGLYGIALLVVTIIVNVRVVLLLLPTVLAEGIGVGAIRRAFALSNGVAWRMFGVWLLFVVIYLVARMAVTSAIGGVLGLLIGSDGPFGFVNIVVALLGGLVTTAYVLVATGFFANLYLALRHAREGAPAAA